MFYSCNSTDNLEINAYLFRVIYNYSNQQKCINNKSYGRIVCLQFYVENQQSDSVALPIGVINGHECYYSHINVINNRAQTKSPVYQKLLRERNDEILHKGEKTCITIKLYEKDLKDLNIKWDESPNRIIKQLDFKFNSDARDSFPCNVPNIIFHKENTLPKEYLSEIYRESKKNYFIKVDKINNVLYCYNCGKKVKISTLLDLW